MRPTAGSQSTLSALLSEAQRRLKAGDVDGALSRFRRAAENSRGHPDAWRAYVRALHLSGRKSRARKAAQQAPVSGAVRKELLALADGTSPAPPVPQEQIRRLVSLIDSGDLEGARASADALLQNADGSALLHNLRGVIALRSHDAGEAERFFRAAAQRDPEMIDAIANLGLALNHQARGISTVILLEPLVSDPRATPALHINLAAAYAQVGMIDEALGLTDRLLEQTPDDADVLAIRAEALIAGDRAADAAVVLKDLEGRRKAAFDLQDLVASAFEASQGRGAANEYLASVASLTPETELRVASIEAQWGDTEAASLRARRVATDRPDDPRGCRQVALFTTFTADDPLIPEMRAGYDSAKSTPGLRGQFGMSLSKALFDINDPDAFDVLVKANGLLRQGVAYNPDADARHFQRLTSLWDAGTIDRLSKHGTDLVAPVFIIGLPRSGSTLVESMLARHPQIASLGESPVCAGLANLHRAEASRDAVTAVAGRGGRFLAGNSEGYARVTDKLLGNFLHVGLLAAAFPRAIFIEASRDLRATCLSIFQNPLNPGGHPYSMELAELGRFAAGYAGLMTHWQTLLGSRLYRNRYEELVADPEVELRRVLDAIGLPFDPVCLAPTGQTQRVNTLSVAQVRKPVHTQSTERWRAFETELQPLIDALKEGGVTGL